MQFRLSAAAIIFAASLVYSRSALGSSALTVAPATSGSLLVSGNLNGAGAFVVQPSSATLDLISSRPVTIGNSVTETSPSPASDDFGGATLSLASWSATALTLSGASTNLFTAGEELTASELSLATSYAGAITEPSVAAEDIVIPEFPTVPEPAAWQGLTIGAACAAAMLYRRNRNSAAAA